MTHVVMTHVVAVVGLQSGLKMKKQEGGVAVVAIAKESSKGPTSNTVLYT